MHTPVFLTVIEFLAIAAIFGVLIYRWFKNRNPLNKMKLKETGQGQHGSAKWSTKEDAENTFKIIPYRPDLWREGMDLPEYDGLVVCCEPHERGNVIQKFISKEDYNPDCPFDCWIDDGDVHMLMIGAAGVGKTANFLYPNIEYAFAAGMSFLTTDTKGDLYRNTGTIGEKYYGYKIKVLDLRNPLQSSGYNMLYLVCKYFDMYKKTGKRGYQAKAEKYAKIVSKTIIEADLDMSQMGQNAYFYESAEGIITATVLLIAEYCNNEEKHVVSVFKLIQDLLSPSNKEGMNQFQVLIDLLPEESRIRWFAGTALETAPETMQSVMSTAMSKLLSFLDSELEQILCFNNDINIEKFCKEKTAIYIVLPEEDTTKHFIASLFISQIYNEILLIADANGGALNKRVVFYCDEIGTMPKIQGFEEMFSSGRSRKVSIVAIIQSLSQFEKKYGKEGAEIITDNCQLTLFGGFAGNSETAKRLSENLGKQTVESGSVTYSGESHLVERAQSRSINMIERSLMTTDELKTLPKGHFILMKTGCHPFKVTLQLFLKWGIKFEEKYKIKNVEEQQATYADKNELVKRVVISNPAFDD